MCRVTVANSAGRTPQVEHVEVQQVECEQDNPIRAASAQVLLQRAKVGLALWREHTRLAVDDRCMCVETRGGSGNPPNFSVQSLPRRVRIFTPASRRCTCTR